MIFVGVVSRIKKKFVIEPLRKVLSAGTESVKIFKYLGLDIMWNNKYDVSLSQSKFMDAIKEIEITGDISKQKHLGLNEEELKSFRVPIGQLLWVSNQTGLDISCNLSELSSSINHATVQHILRANKVLKMLVWTTLANVN